VTQKKSAAFSARAFIKVKSLLHEVPLDLSGGIKWREFVKRE
jgi:hypothetical protein